MATAPHSRPARSTYSLLLAAAIGAWCGSAAAAQGESGPAAADASAGYGGAALDAAVSTAVAAALAEAVLEVSVNSESAGESLVVLRGPGNSIYLAEEDLKRLHLRVPHVAAVEREGRRYYALAAVVGSRVRIDDARQRALVTVPAAAFEPNEVSAAERSHPKITPAAPGAFFNYQVSAQQIQGTSFGGLQGELGVFASPGVLTDTFVARRDAGQNQFVRLDSTFTHDWVDSLQTLNLGDSISDPGTWGNALRFAGIRFSRNFALRPDLLTTPLLSASGTATVPSTVDVFVNNQLVNSSTLPAGPFVIDRLPSITGTGDMSVVVRDALGREQVMTQSFYTSPFLLAAGLSQYAIDVGSVRNNYGITSTDYGAPIAEGSYRRGITDDFTLEGHAEYLKNFAHAAGVNAAYQIDHLGVINVTAANGGGFGGSGWLTGVGIEHRGSRASLVASTQWASRNFVQVGESPDPDFWITRRDLLQGGVSVGRTFSISVAWVRELFRNEPSQRSLSLTNTWSFGPLGALELTVARTVVGAGTPSLAPSALPPGGIVPPTGFLPGSGFTAAQSSTSVFLNYVYSLGGRKSVTASGIGGSGEGAPPREGRVTYTDSPPVGPGYGYRLAAATNGDYDADWQQQGRAASLEVEAARTQGVDGRSAYLTGAFTWLDGRFDALRSVNSSFGMVDLDGLANVPVYVENQLTARTDDAGRALLFNLRPYEANRVSIVPQDLPLDTTIESASTTVAPPFRSGVVVRFPVERTRGGTFRLVTEDGTAVPTGAEVVFNGGKFPVVLDGKVYVTGYDHGTQGSATWKEGRCVFRLPPPPADDPLPELGTVRCRSLPATGDRAEGRR